MSESISYHLSGKERQKQEIADVEDKLCTLSKDIKEESDDLEKTVLIKEYWVRYDHYQNLVQEMACEYGSNPNDFRFWESPHLTVLDSS